MLGVAGWVAGLDAVVEIIGARFFRVEPRRRAGAYLRGLLAGLERKNGWTLAEAAGAKSPDGMQRLLRTADWDVRGAREDLRGYAVAGLRPQECAAPVAEAAAVSVPVVWVIDETGFVKKGSRSAGVQRQYTGTTGKIDNCQLGVFLAVVTARGRALVDAELYLPASWTDDAARCADAGIPADVEFATKPELGAVMLARALSAGHLRPAGQAGELSTRTPDWVAADEAYGQNRTFRAWLVDHGVPFVLATRSDDRLKSADGIRRRATALAAMVPEHAWEERSAGAGAHGHRYYAWAQVDLDPTGLPPGWGHRLLVRRQIDPPTGKAPELAFYRCAGPAATTITTLVRVAGARWGIEESFQTAKNETGLDHYQARSWRAWHAHTTLSMLAAAYLAVTRASEHDADDRAAEQDGHPQKGGPLAATTA